MRTFRSAATGLVKNIVPKREKAKSKVSSNGVTCTSATTKRAFDTPASAASPRAVSMKLAAASTPTASPSGPTRPAIRWVESPKPQPMSSTRCPLFGGTSRSASSPCAARPFVRTSRKRTKRSNSGPSQALIASAFGPGPHRVWKELIVSITSLRVTFLGRGVSRG